VHKGERADGESVRWRDTEKKTERGTTRDRGPAFWSHRGNTPQHNDITTHKSMLSG